MLLLAQKIQSGELTREQAVELIQVAMEKTVESHQDTFMKHLATLANSEPERATP